jgi:hypothetical protein
VGSNPLIKDMNVEIGIAMNADHDGAVLDCRDFEHVLFTAQWSGASATDGLFELQISNLASSNFEGYPDAQYTASTAAGAHHWDMPINSIPFVRIAYAKGSNTAGLYAITAWVKRR